MDRFFDFGLGGDGLAGTRFLVSRPDLPEPGDIEGAFLEGLAAPARHPPGTGLGDAVAAALARPGTGTLVLVRNPRLVLDGALPRRLAAARAALAPLGPWSIAAAGGLGPAGRRHLALYASASPAIPDGTGPHPLVDPLPDLTLIDAAFARDVVAEAPALPGEALETILAAEGYLAGRISAFLPGLAAGIDGTLLAHDQDAVAAELARHFARRLPGQTLPTLGGPVAIPDADAARPGGAVLADCVAAAVAARAAPLGLSIVVRTRFDRDHLLRRLLTSIARARRDTVEIEVILSSDAEPVLCARAAEALEADFGALALRLQQNPPGLHSRVTNLIGGIRAARHDYVVLIDDDDQVELFAFDALARARFADACPLIVTGSEVRAETWEETPGGRWVLSEGRPTTTYPADGWRRMFGGINRLPISALVIPRARLVARLDAFTPSHDLSEDYALFLLLLTDPELPEILEIPETFSRISVRGTENSVSQPDRRPWARDIALHLAELVADRTVAPPGLWALLAAAGTEAMFDQAALDAATAALDRARADARLLRREIETLRRELAREREPAQ